jgi:hypothetical protein
VRRSQGRDEGKESMSIGRTVSGALAWTGLVIVIAVPAAEAVWSRMAPDQRGAARVDMAEVPSTPSAAAPAKPATAAPVGAATTASAAPADTKPANGGTALDDYLASGKPLPSYIKPPTGAVPAKPASTPAAPAKPVVASVAPAPQVKPAVEPTASVQPAQKPATTEASVAPASKPVSPPVAPQPVPAAQPNVAAVTPASPPKPKPVKPRTVTEADLKEWKSGTLADFLKARGLLTPDGGDASPQ